jgi:tetratricopeptide (TPR) repeat protein
MDESLVQRAIESGDPRVADEAFNQIDGQFKSTSDIKEKARLLLGKATLYGVLGRFTDARKQLELASQVAPEDTDIRLQRDFIDGSLYDQERRPEQAYLKLSSVLSDYTERLSWPDVRFMYEDIQLRRGFDATSIGRFKDALSILTECLSFKLEQRDKSLVFADLGRCYSEIGDYESAKNYLVSAIDMGLTDGHLGQAHMFLGIAYARLGLFHEASKEFQLCEEKAVEYGLEIVKVYGWLSWVSKALGKHSESERYSRLMRPS